MSNTQNDIDKRAQQLGDSLQKLTWRLGDITNPLYPEAAQSARQKAAEAVQEAVDAVDALHAAQTAERGALGAYEANMKRFVNGDTKTKPKAPSPIELQKTTVEALGLASARLGQATAAVKAAEEVANSPETQEAYRETVREQVRKTREALAEAIQPFRSAFEAHVRTRNLAYQAFRPLAGQDLVRLGNSVGRSGPETGMDEIWSWLMTMTDPAAHPAKNMGWLELKDSEIEAGGLQDLAGGR
jgi:hypothetical protein